MIERILSLFPSSAHPLIMTSDPDGLLAGETVLSELTARGFRFMQEEDPVVLRYQVENARPFTVEKPLLIITRRPLEEMPFDLWQQAHKIMLSLHPFFPNLAYPILHTLTPGQLEILMSCRQPVERLGRLGTIDYILQNVFSLDLQALGKKHELISWLVHLHSQLFPLPWLLEERVLDQLKKYPQYATWDVPQLIRS